MKKKILSLILAMLMAASSAAMVAADDVVLTAAKENATHAASAEFLQSQEIMKGKEDGDLALNDNIKRYEMALFVSRISTGWTDDKAWDNGMVNNTGYTDLEGSGAINVMGAITYADQKGIIEGYGNGEFGPEDGITYQDALTMAVRTLGYKKLGWPWEYIEKAIELGLTKNVTDKAYTAVLNRGEVAQLIYNTLNTPKRDGYTLAFEKFNMIEETIIITASDRSVFEKGAITAPAGKVAFKTYDVATATLGQVTYYANASEFALEGHADELSVGYIYNVLLNTDKEGNIVTAANGTIVKGYEATAKTEIENANGDIKITAAVKDLKIASKYFRAKSDETLVFDAMTNATVNVTIGGIAMDWVTGDILVECFEEDGYTHIAENGKFYKIAWHYNAFMNKYFAYKLNSNGGIIGFDWLEDADLLETIAALKAATTTETRRAGFTQLTKLTSAQQGSAYAELELQKFEENAAYLMGVYEEYGLGYIVKNSKVKCTECNKDYAGFDFYTVENKMVVETEGEILLTGKEGTCLTHAFTAPACDAHGVWFSELEVAANDAFVIYGYNAATGEVKVVKELQKQYGVLRAYTTITDKATNRTPKVLIGGEMIPLGYDNLKGAGFQNVSKNALNYLDGLDALLNTYVEYIVVDGKVVSIRACERDLAADKYLVMEEFVGMTEDGAIVVEAYSTTTGELARYRVNSYNGFYQNTFYYYADFATLAAQFASGNLYYVTNYVNSNTIDIELVGGYDENGDFVVDTNKVVLIDKSYAFTIDGYKIVDGKEAEKDLQANEGTYVVISPKQEIGRAPIYIYSGEVYDLTWHISGQILKNVPGVSVFVSIDKYEEGEFAGELMMNGFALDAHKHGMYMYDGGKIYEAAYDRDAFETFFGADTSLILPTDNYYVIELIDMYTGKTTTRALRNLKREDIIDNTIYVTIGDNVEYIARGAYDFIFEMGATFYQDTYVDVFGRDARTSADYVFGAIEDLTIRGKKGVDTTVLTADLIATCGFAEARFAKVDAKGIKQFVVSSTEEGAVDLIAVDETVAATLEGKTVGVDYVYSIATNGIAVYITIVGDPETEAPDETEAPETQAPETQAPETQAPETQAPETQAPETQAPETQAPETQAPETQAPETAPAVPSEIVVTITINSTEVANSFALSELAYDASLLTFAGFDADVADCDALLKSMFQGQGIDGNLNTVVIALMSPEALNGKVCDLKFTVAEGADVAAAIAAAANVTFKLDVKNNSAVIETCTLTATVEAIYAE